MRASVVISTRNEGRALMKTVRECLETTEALECEIVVANDASEDDSVDRLRDAFPHVRVVSHTERRGVALTKDLGARCASGEVLVFLDGHCKPEPQAIERLVADVEELEGQAIVTPSVPALDVELWETDPVHVGHGYTLDLDTFEVGWVGLEALRPRGASPFYRQPTLCGCIAAMSRNLYETLWGFDTGMRSYGSEDVDLGVKAWLMGFEVLHDPRPAVGHRFRNGATPDELPPPHVLANQLRMARKTFTDPVWFEWLGRCGTRHPSALFHQAWSAFLGGYESVERERSYLLSRRTRDEFWYAREFGGAWPAASGSSPMLPTRSRPFVFALAHPNGGEPRELGGADEPEEYPEPSPYQGYKPKSTSLGSPTPPPRGGTRPAVPGVTPTPSPPRKMSNPGHFGVTPTPRPPAWSTPTSSMREPTLVMSAVNGNGASNGHTNRVHAGPVKVLVAITNHGPRRNDFVKLLICNYHSMSFPVDVAVFSDAPKRFPNGTKLMVGLPSNDPESLPFAHKRLFADEVDHYDLFVYSEDDVLISEENLRAFLEASEQLAPDEVPGFLRFEDDPASGRLFVDAHEPFDWIERSVRRSGPSVFASYSNEHSGCYALTRAQLKRALGSGGYLVAPHDSYFGLRESAATDPYTRCGLTKRICLSELDRFLVRHLIPNSAGIRGTEESALRAQVAELLTRV